MYNTKLDIVVVVSILLCHGVSKKTSHTVIQERKKTHREINTAQKNRTFSVVEAAREREREPTRRLRRHHRRRQLLRPRSLSKSI